ncbi:hypothetical protein [uncultured Prevotella sp.]|uniref:hypothetical protein n=1 Tax=uncultured Prevotella sp. TaxID=159272 RepID=UPI0025849342|nr:hypothetical protein [uncultured Prevotella sp.]
MGFQALLTREDYYGILKDTLQRYYTQRYGDGIEVGYEPKTGAAELIMNPRLGMIFQPFPPRKPRKYLYRSYNIRGNIVKNIAAKVFVFLSTHSRNLFTMQKKLYIYPAGMIKRDMMICYLNRSIRIFDFEEGKTVSIQKETFTSKFFQNQLQFRNGNNYSYIPPITAYGENWFEENILEGKSLARETDKDKFTAGENQALASILELVKRKIELADSKAYITDIIEGCRQFLTGAKETKGINTINEATNYLELLSTVLVQAPEKLPLAESHGDLQAGNIWLEEKKAWIIDWETHAKRSIWFDVTTLIFGTRYYGGIRTLTSKLKEDGLKETMLHGQQCDWNARSMVALFLLEDLLFYLEDMMELPGQGGKDSFDIYMNELSEINWHQVFEEA